MCVVICALRSLCTAKVLLKKKKIRSAIIQFPWPPFVRMFPERICTCRHSHMTPTQKLNGCYSSIPMGRTIPGVESKKISSSYVNAQCEDCIAKLVL